MAAGHSAKQRERTTIRRDSDRADALVKALDGITIRNRRKAADGSYDEIRRQVTGRMLEDLSKDGLIHPDDHRIVENIQALDELGYGPGKDADEISLRLLARRIGVDRARWILTELAANLTVVREMLNQASPQDLEPLMDELAEHPNHNVIAPLIKRINAAVTADTPIGGRTTYNGEVLDETPEARARGFGRSVIEMIVSRPQNVNVDLLLDVMGSPWPDERWQRTHDGKLRDLGVFKPDPKRRERTASPVELEITESVVAYLSAVIERTPRIIATVPLVVLEAAAGMAQTMCAAFVAPGFDDRKRDGMRGVEVSCTCLRARPPPCNVHRGGPLDALWAAAPPTSTSFVSRRHSRLHRS